MLTLLQKFKVFRWLWHYYEVSDNNISPLVGTDLVIHSSTWMFPGYESLTEDLFNSYFISNLREVDHVFTIGC